MKKKKNHSSKIWLLEHFKDIFVKEAKKKKIYSRSFFKLQDIDLKNNILRNGMNILDLGSSPGGWLQYVIQKLHNFGQIISCDLNNIKMIPKICFIKGNLLNKKIFCVLLNKIKKKINLVMSDMSPKITGIPNIDISHSLILSNLALKIAICTLSNNGVFLVKVFQGNYLNIFINKLRNIFCYVKICKPKSSRDRSREIFILSKSLQQ